MGTKRSRTKKDCVQTTLNYCIKVTENLNIHLEDSVSTKTNHRKLHKVERAATAKTLVTDTKDKMWKIWCSDHKTWKITNPMWTVWKEEWKTDPLLHHLKQLEDAFADNMETIQSFMNLRRMKVVLKANGGKTFIIKYCLFSMCSHYFVQPLYKTTLYYCKVLPLEISFKI